MGFYLRCYEEGAQAMFSEPFDYQKFMIERYKSSPAYLYAFSLISDITPPSPKAPESDEKAQGWLRKSPPASAPGTAALQMQRLSEAISWLKYGLFALVGIAVILLARLG